MPATLTLLPESCSRCDLPMVLEWTCFIGTDAEPMRHANCGLAEDVMETHPEWFQAYPRSSEGGDALMGLTKHGHGEILQEDDDSQKTAQANWSDKDEKALKEENEKADSTQ